MFTSIVTAVGKVRKAVLGPKGLTLVIGAPYRGVRKGESIAVDGACLTVEKSGTGWFQVHVVRTSLERTLFSSYAKGRPVNLERALAANARLGGHFVQGHVDDTAQVIDFSQRGADWRLGPLHQDPVDNHQDMGGQQRSEQGPDTGQPKLS